MALAAISFNILLNLSHIKILVIGVDTVIILFTYRF